MNEWRTANGHHALLIHPLRDVWLKVGVLIYEVMEVRQITLMRDGRTSSWCWDLPLTPPPYHCWTQVGSSWTTWASDPRLVHSSIHHYPQQLTSPVWPALSTTHTGKILSAYCGEKFDILREKSFMYYLSISRFPGKNWYSSAVMLQIWLCVRLVNAVERLSCDQRRVQTEHKANFRSSTIAHRLDKFIWVDTKYGKKQNKKSQVKSGVAYCLRLWRWRTEVAK